MSAFSQKKKKYNRIYTDENLKTKLRHLATFYIDREFIEETKDYEIFRQKVYFMDGILHEICTLKYKKEIDLTCRVGLATKYFKNGKFYSIKNFEDCREIGEFKEYFENGELKMHGRKDSWNIYMYAYTDSMGNKTVVNGNGKYTIFDKSKDRFFNYEVEDSLVMLGYYIDTNKDTIYKITDVPIEPVEGWNIFRRKIQYVLKDVDRGKYIARDFEIELIISETGEVADVRLFKSITSEEDYKIKDFFKNVIRFKEPVLKNGQRVKVLIEISYYLYKIS